MIEPPSCKGNQFVKGPFDDYKFVHVRPVPTHHVHRVLMGYPDKVGAKSHLVESPQDWVDRVTSQQHFDPGWAGKEAMVAPDGHVDHEHAWAQTKRGVTLLIPSYEQLRNFEDQATIEFADQYYSTRNERRSNHVFERCDGPRNFMLKEKLVLDALRAMSVSVNIIC